MSERKLVILGGDKRLDYVYDKFSENNKSCVRINSYTENLSDVISGAVYIVLPVPCCDSKSNIFSVNKDFKLSCDALVEMLSDKNIVFGCNFSKELIYQLGRKNIIYYDLNRNEEFLIYNAFLTAQSALRLMLENTEALLTDKRVLITGFGRVSRALAHTLKGVTPDITVCARKKEQLNEAYCLSYKTTTYDKLSDTISNYDIIFNTVPDRIFDKEKISLFKGDAVYVELASSPYGADRNDFEISNKQYILAGGLPGKYTPYSAGKKIAEIIEKLI